MLFFTTRGICRALLLRVLEDISQCSQKSSHKCFFPRVFMSFRSFICSRRLSKPDVGYKAPRKANECSNLMQSHAHPNPVHQLIYFAAALTFANDFRTSKRACFLKRITLNLSKSVRARLFSFCVRFSAHALSCHFASIPAFSHCAFTTPVLAARGSLARIKGVRMSCARAIDWRGTAVLVEVDGPSMRAYFMSILVPQALESLQNHVRACDRWFRQ